MFIAKVQQFSASTSLRDGVPGRVEAISEIASASLLSLPRNDRLNAYPSVLALIVFMMVSVCFVSFASGAVDRFGEANQFYRDKKYDEAVRIYEEVVKSRPMAEVYYNLGNSYFKSKKLGWAILNYERARRLKPRDRDALTNLAYANRLIEYRIEDKQNWYFRKKSELLQFVTIEECWALALGAYFLFMVGLFISLARRQRPFFGRLGALAICLLIFCSVPLLLKLGERGMGRPGIVTEPQAEVRYGPSNSDRIAFRLVEGLKVSLNDEKQDWYRVQLTDGRGGWVPKSQVTPV